MSKRTGPGTVDRRRPGAADLSLPGGALTGCDSPAVGESVAVRYAGRDLRLWRMPSSSRAYPRPVEWKAEFYRRVFAENGII